MGDTTATASTPPQPSVTSSSSSPSSTFGAGWRAVARPGVVRAMVLMTVRQVQVQKVNFLLGFLSCFVVVLTVSILYTILGNTPVVFLRLAELQGGELDLQLSAGDWMGYKAVNYTQLDAALRAGGSAYELSAPRLRSEVRLVTARCCAAAGFDVADPAVRYFGRARNASADCYRSGVPTACLAEVCPGTDCAASATLLAIDTQREKDMGFGRAWELDAPAPGHVHVAADIAEALRVGPGDTVVLSLRLSEAMAGAWMDALRPWIASGDRALDMWALTLVPLVVDGVFDDIAGKAENTLSDAIVMDYASLLGTAAAQAAPTLAPEARAALQTADPAHYAPTVVFNMDADTRNAVYISSDFDSVRTGLVGWVSALMYRAGFNQLDSSLPIADRLAETRFFSLFTGLILNIVILILVGLAALLIYSLLMVNVETRTFELGVLRMIGMPRAGVVELLLVQAVGYGLPACVLGVAAAQVGEVIVSLVFYNLTAVTMSPWLTWQGVALAVALGLLTPVVASLVPIANALSSNLHDALDLKHSKLQAVVVKLERSEQSSMSWSLVLLGSALTLFGFGIYYLFPLALITLNLSLLMNMFFALLICMMLGMVIVSLNLEHLFENVLLALLFFWERRAVRAVVAKNLVAHRIRNRKTTVLFAVAISFIIFIVVSYQSTVQAVVYQLQDVHGGSVQIRMSYYDPQRRAMRRADLTRIENALRKSADVVAFGWISETWDRSVSGGGWTDLCNIGRTYCYGQRVYAITPNYFGAVIPGFLKMTDAYWDALTGMLLSERLYTVEGSYHALIGSLYRTQSGISDLATQFLLRFGHSSGEAMVTNVTLARLLPEAFLEVSPGFRASKYPEFRSQDVQLSFPSFLRYLHGTYESARDVPIYHGSLRLRDGITDSEVQDLVRQLQPELLGLPGASLWDLPTAMEPFNIANEILFYFFAFTTVVAMAVASFSLVSSMYTNVYEQTREIGMLRAIGLPRTWLYRIYVYEAFILVVASSLLGTLVGTAIAYTLILQRVLFTQLPLPFLFPWQLMSLVFVFSVVFAVLSSLIPIFVLLRQPIRQLR